MKFNEYWWLTGEIRKLKNLYWFFNDVHILKEVRYDYLKSAGCCSIILCWITVLNLDAQNNNRLSYCDHDFDSLTKRKNRFNQYGIKNYKFIITFEKSAALHNDDVN